jgi:Transposase DDE domain
MDLETFLTAVYCLTDDALHNVLQGARLRQRGPRPLLADSEALAMEIAGEFLGIETDYGIYRYFRRHWPQLYPALRRVHRTTFLRQAANLWLVKEAIWQELVRQLRRDEGLSILDSVPVPVCRFARAHRCRLFPGSAAYGKDSLLPGTFFGLRAHLRVVWPGVIAAFDLAPANASDLAVAPLLLRHTRGFALGDRAYWSPRLRLELLRGGVSLLAPFQTATHEKAPWPRWLVAKRRRIETVLAQLVERFHSKRTWARDLWHLCSRWLRKVLSHTTAVLLCQQHGLAPLSFRQLVAT